MPVGARELGAMRVLDPTGVRLRLSRHVRGRLYDRAIPDWVVRQIALASGEVIYRNLDHCPVLVLLGQTENGRPLHVQVKIDFEARGWGIITSLRPDTRPWKWSTDFRQCLCFDGGRFDD